MKLLHSRPPRALRILLPVFAGVIFIGLWYAARALVPTGQQFLLPAPHTVAQAFGRERATLFEAALTTLAGASGGFIAATVLSCGFALLLSLSSWIRAGLYPFLLMLQLTPVIIITPILVLWVGPGLPSVTIITFLICFFPLTVNTTQGLISTERGLVELFRLYRAQRWQEIFLLRVPHALPYFFTGLRISAVLAPIGAIAGDFYAGNAAGGRGGLGFLTLLYSANFKIPALYATAFVSCLLGFLFAGIAVGLAWLCLHHWHETYAKSD